MLGGWKVLVHGAAVWDEAQAQLEVSGQAAIRSQCKDQQRCNQEEAHHDIFVTKLRLMLFLDNKNTLGLYDAEKSGLVIVQP